MSTGSQRSLERIISGMASVASHVDSQDRKSLLKVRAKHGEVNAMIESLSERVNQVAIAQEKEFLSAYRVHMLSVQLELKELKMKVAEAEESLLDDGVVSKLEEECNWFRNETIRLQSHSTSMQNDINQMQSRLKSLWEQCQYLSDQLKAVMKKSRVMEAEIEYFGKLTGIFNNQSQSESESGNDNNNAHGPTQAHEGRSASRGTKMIKSSKSTGTLSQTTWKKTADKSQLGPTTTLSDSLDVYASTAPPGQRHVLVSPPSRGRLKTSSTPKKKTVHALSPVNVTMKAQQQRAMATHSRHDHSRGGNGGNISNVDDLETLRRKYKEITDNKNFVECILESCVKQSFSSVIKRRSLSIMKNSKNRYVKSSIAEITKDEDKADGIEATDLSSHFSTDVPTDKHGYPIIGGVAELGLDHLLHSDRLSAMVQFLSNADVVQEIFKRYYENPVCIE